MLRFGTLRVDRLYTIHAQELSRFFEAQMDEYMRWFDPFPYDWPTMERMLKGATHDLFMGVWLLKEMSPELIAFWMLRGWDAGESVPEFGLVVDQHHAWRGIGRACLDMAISTCRMNQVPRMRLTCHTENRHAMNLYEQNGFCRTHQSGTLVYMERTL